MISGQLNPNHLNFNKELHSYPAWESNIHYSSMFSFTTNHINSIKSSKQTRHILVFSKSSLNSIAQEKLIKHVQNRVLGDIRAIYASTSLKDITIISYFRLKEAENCLNSIEKEFKFDYQVYYAKPCVIKKKLNEKIFVMMNTLKPNETQQFNYMKHLSSVGSIHSISESMLSAYCLIVNLEYDDERSNEKLITEYHNRYIEGVQFNIFKASNDQFLCICHQLKDTFYPIYPKNTLCNQDLTTESYFSDNLFDMNSLSLSISENIMSKENSTSLSSCSVSSSKDSQISLNLFNSNQNDQKGESKFQSFQRGSSDSHIQKQCSSNPHSLQLSPDLLEKDESCLLVLNSARNELVLSNSPPENFFTLNSSQRDFLNKNEQNQPDFLTSNPFEIENHEVLTPTITINSKLLAHLVSTNDIHDININKINKGQDKRTTFMIRNIPNKYTQQMLIDCINATHKDTYDFIYLPIDFQNKCNVGYAFINFIDPRTSIDFINERVGKKWEHFNSDKILSLSYATVQGKKALIKKFKNSNVMAEEEAYRPKIFYSTGVNKGKEQEFPKPDATEKHKLFSINPRQGSRQSSRQGSRRHSYKA